MEATLAQENATDNTSQGVNTIQILGLKSGHISLGIYLIYFVDLLHLFKNN